MEFVLKKGDVISLEGQPFQILKNIENNGLAYDCIYKIPENIAMIADGKNLEYTFIKEIINGGKLSVEEVHDEEIYKELKNKFLKIK